MTGSFTLKCRTFCKKKTDGPSKQVVSQDRSRCTLKSTVMFEELDCNVRTHKNDIHGSVYSQLLLAVIPVI